MTFDKINRRTHLYLAMFLLPWFFMYGISSIPFTRNAYFQQLYDDGVPQWTVRFDRDYRFPVPDEEDLRPTAQKILQDVGLASSFGVHRPNDQRLNIYLFDFWSATRLTYFIDENRLLAEDRRFRWDHFLTGMHARGGFQQNSFLDDAWALTIDGVMLAILVWIASGIYMWWHVKGVRMWGLLALGGGLASFLMFLLAL